MDFQQPVESMAQHHTPTRRHEYVPRRPNVVWMRVSSESHSDVDCHRSLGGSPALAESTSSATLQAQLSGYGSRLVQIQEVLDRMGVKEPSEMEKWCVRAFFFCGLATCALTPSVQGLEAGSRARGHVHEGPLPHHLRPQQDRLARSRRQRAPHLRQIRRCTYTHYLPTPPSFAQARSLLCRVVVVGRVVRVTLFWRVRWQSAS